MIYGDLWGWAVIFFATMLGARMGRWLGPGGCLNCDLRGFVGMGCDLLCNDAGREEWGDGWDSGVV